MYDTRIASLAQFVCLGDPFFQEEEVQWRRSDQEGTGLVFED